jgi:flagellar motor switch protein FliN/FliY
MDAKGALLEKWPAEFARAVEMMTGSAVRVSEGAGSPPVDFWWENQLTTDPPARLRVGGSYEAWFGLGSAVLKAAGVEPAEEADARSTFLELVEQAASAAAEALSTPSHRVESSTGTEVTAAVSGAEGVVIEFDGQRYTVALSVEVSRSGPAPEKQPAAMAAAAGAGGGEPFPALSGAASRTPVAGAKTMDALLDVHLPVAISFGHARMPLKDVLKLTAGTVVELNRQPEDPVDIIVNDCVIARGEVVVVDGNYAVRIQSIVGRQDRLGLSAPQRDKGRFSA